MGFQAQNPDLSLGYVRPGVYVAVNLAAPGGGVDNVAKRMLVYAYKLSTGTAPLDAPFQVVSLQDAIDGCGAKSDAARGVAAALTQVGAGEIDLFVCPLLEPSGGTAATYKVIFAGATATAPGSVDLTINGRAILSVGFATGDAYTAISAAVKTAVDNLSSAPCVASESGGTLTLTYPHKGQVGEDLPIRCNINGTGTGITASAGSIVFATAVTGAGSVTVTIGAITITTAIANGDTAAQVATKVVASFAAGGYPLTAAIGSAPENVDLFFVKGRDYRRVTTAIVSSTGITATITSFGTVGAGIPTLTASLSNLSGLPGFGSWATPFVGSQASPDLATLGTIATHVEAQADGLRQKEQRVHAGAPWTAASFGTIPVGTSPALTSSPRYAMIWAQDFGVQVWELTARIAAARMANDNPARNWDGVALKGSATCPIVLPAVASQPSGDVINAAMRSYYLCPIVVNPLTNVAVIEKATTTSNSPYQPLRDFSTIDQVAFWRVDLAAHLANTFGDAQAKQFSPPRTPNTISESSVAQEMYMQALEWDERDLYDGAETFKAGFKSKFNPSNPTRIDASFPMSPVVAVHQIGVVGNLVSGSR